MVTTSMVLGLAVAPMGWVMTLAATVTPRWREFSARPGFPRDVSFSDGLLESRLEVAAVPCRAVPCRAVPDKAAVSWPMHMLRAMTVLSVLAGALSCSIANAGVRWRTRPPDPRLTGTAGLLLVLRGATDLCAVSYMAYRVLDNIASPQTPAADKLHMGPCLYLGWTGGGLEILTSLCLAVNCPRKQE
ncbi:claudin-7-like [Alligator mississippiensis]|uniref:Claudin-7-like n=1 Tax=Alligator mississippiensis TaxID=8496 RepID=A0A151N0X3_ALLMI|nr:claudin-7-like [Alligator mississippiensis]